MHTNADGSVELWATLPLRFVRADGAVFTRVGLRRKNGRCFLYGGWTGGEGPGEIDVGDDKFDVSDMPISHTPGGIWEFPTFEYLKAKLHPDNKAKIVSYRVITRAEIPTDRTYRDAWRHDGKKFFEDVDKRREIQARNAVQAEQVAARQAAIQAKIEELKK